MLPIPEEIKDKLVKALDDENDVDDATVVEMVSILEKYPITRATLEETKIGKMVNDLRRKIKNEKLAKRVKQLVRNWKKILDETPPVNGGVPGPMHPAISQLRSSPAISPALSRVSSTGALSSPALGKVPLASPKVSSVPGKPSTPKQIGKKIVSPALASYRPVTGGSHKALSPGLGTNGVPIPSAAAVQKVMSPALSSIPLRVASPALVSRTASPTIPGQVVSPAVSNAVESKGVSGHAASPSVSGHVSSPVLKAVVGHGRSKVNPLLAQSSVKSPELQFHRTSRHERGMSADRSRLRKVASTGEISTVGGKASPTFHCESSRMDRLGGETEKGRQDSEESCRSSKTGGSHKAHPPNHSVKTTLSLNSNQKNYKDQRELSKTNIANRKRAREIPDSSQEESNKRSRVDSPSLSANSHRHKVINGCSSKSNKKHVAAFEASRIHSFSSMSTVHSGHVSSPHQSRTSVEESLSLPRSQSDSFLIQENSESNLSSQSLERMSRDKHKVKTTEQLIEDLQKKNNGSKIGHTIMTKLRTNQIEQEQDLPSSVLPVGMKPRGKRGRPRKNEVAPVPPSNIKLSQVKSEMVERFLNTSDPASSLDEYSPFKDDLLLDPDQPAVVSKEPLRTCDSVCSSDNVDTASTSRHDFPEPTPKEEINRDATCLSPRASTSQAERTGSALTLEEIYAQLPPIDHDIDWDAVDFFELPEPAPVTEESVECLHSERLQSINGIYDVNGDWTSWQEVVTLPSFEGNQLHILPYVDLDS